MPESFFVGQRRMQKQQLLSTIKEHKDMPLKKILALFSLKTGLKVSTLEVYLKELRDAELIE